jgi:hypothetical protein
MSAWPWPVVESENETNRIPYSSRDLDILRRSVTLGLEARDNDPWILR